MCSKVLHDTNILFMFSLIVEPPPLHPYEQERLKRCMQNSARLEELGIHHLYRELQEANSIAHKDKKNKPSYKNYEHSESDYDPSEDDISDDNAMAVLLHVIRN